MPSVTTTVVGRRVIPRRHEAMDHRVLTARNEKSMASRKIRAQHFLDCRRSEGTAPPTSTYYRLAADFSICQDRSDKIWSHIFRLISEIWNLRIAGFGGDTISHGRKNQRGVKDYAWTNLCLGFCGGDSDFCFWGGWRSGKWIGGERLPEIAVGGAGGNIAGWKIDCVHDCAI
jgi:hypothetical protein